MPNSTIQEYMKRTMELPLTGYEIEIAALAKRFVGNGFSVEEIAYFNRVCNEIANLKRNKDPRVKNLESELSED